MGYSIVFKLELIVLNSNKVESEVMRSTITRAQPFKCIWSEEDAHSAPQCLRLSSDTCVYRMVQMPIKFGTELADHFGTMLSCELFGLLVIKAKLTRQLTTDWTNHELLMVSGWRMTGVHLLMLFKTVPWSLVQELWDMYCTVKILQWGIWKYK